MSNNYSMDVVPEGHLLLVHHQDKSGAIGRVGNLLAERDVNIETMQVGWKDIGGNTIIMLTIDRLLSIEELAEVAAVEGFEKVAEVDL